MEEWNVAATCLNAIDVLTRYQPLLVKNYVSTDLDISVKAKLTR